MKRATKKYTEDWILRSPPASAAVLRDILASDARQAAEIRRLRADAKRKDATIVVATRHMSSMALATLAAEVEYTLRPAKKGKR